MDPKKRFGALLKKYRIQKEMTLRNITQKVAYDSSNWSKIERGELAPPREDAIIKKWARALGVPNKKDTADLLDSAKVAQGIIPQDILESKMVDMLPAFFRTIRNEKPTKEELDRLLELIKNA